MTLEKIRQKAKELHAKTRRALLRGMTVPLLVAVLAGWVSAQIDVAPVLRALFALAIVWSLAGQYFLNRGMWSAMPPRDAALSPGLESYRREVERRRHLSEGFLLWSLGPVVLALATFLVPMLRLGIRRGVILNMIPFLALLAVWIVSVVVIRMRDQRDLKREIDELNEIERGK
jgi:4-hydroxybenzoate polyprenyltransferase